MKNKEMMKGRHYRPQNLTAHLVQRPSVGGKADHREESLHTCLALVLVHMVEGSLTDQGAEASIPPAEHMASCRKPFLKRKSRLTGMSGFFLRSRCIQ